MPSDPAAALSALLRQSSIQDHDEILKAANAAIKADKSDVQSQHTRVVALLKLDRFDDALRAISEGGTGLQSCTLLESVYALYKTGKLDEARSALQSSSSDDRGAQHLSAQVAYRAERFDETSAVYHRLLNNDPADEGNDLSINIRAAAAQSQWLGNAPSIPVPTQDLDGFELCYNAACAAIAIGSLDEAAELLQRAVRLCDASDELTEEDKEAEMQPILAQQAFVYAKLGKLKEALDLYKSISDNCEDDADLLVVVKNNLQVLEPQTDNPYLFHRHFASVVSQNKKAKLFQQQSSILQRNEFVVDLQALKAEGVGSRTEALASKADQPTTSAHTNVLSVLNAAANVQGANGKELLRSLQSLSSKRPHDVGLVLTIVQIQLNEGHSGSALSILESFLQRLEKEQDATSQDVRYSPGLTALAVSLMRQQGRQSSAKAELVKAAKHWQARQATKAIPLLEEAGIELARSSNADDLALAGASFQKIFDEQKGSEIAAAGLVASLAPSNPSAIEKHLKDLPPVDDLTDGIDVTALLNTGIASIAKSTPSAKRPAPQEPVGKTTKRRRKIRLPKNYEEGKKPDPERWLPLRDRSTYRPKGKKGKKKAGEATQGGMVKDEETLELVGGGGVKVEKATPSNSKKKKKGKK